MTAPKLRPMRDGDKSHVIASWLRSYRHSADAREVNNAQAKAAMLAVYAAVYDDRPRREAPPSLYYIGHEATIHRLLAVSDITVACVAEDEDTICGWRAVQGGDRLHYVCVKPDFQRLGIGRLLVADIRDKPMILTHWSDTCNGLSLPRGWSYNARALKESVAA